MSARRPLRPLSPLSANIVGAGIKYSYITKVGSDDDVHIAMDRQAQDDNTQDTGSIVSGLTSLGSGDDDFERLMIQNERDQKRLRDAQRGDVRPFSKARTHHRVSLTLDNLERNNAQEDAARGRNSVIKRESPASSNGSARSDPPIHAPRDWGRKGRVKRNWLRTIITDEHSGTRDTGADYEDEQTPRQAPRAQEADLPLPSVEDSPLSHKGSTRNTPASSRRRTPHTQDDTDLDLSIDFNEASMIASTPYIPRSTVLDDIRQREIETLREQALTTNRLDRIRGASPEETRRPQFSSGNLHASEETAPAISTPRLRRRTDSWKTIGKSQAVIGEGGQQPTISPITVYKTGSEITGAVEPGVQVNTQTDNKRPRVHRREDSHELLRRLARVSNTPSPGRVNTLRPQTAPARQTDMSPSAAINANLSEPAAHATQPHGPGPELQLPILPEHPPDPETRQRTIENEHRRYSAPASSEQALDVDMTPIPVDQPPNTTKTPRVTGAWVDTPAPRTAPRPSGASESSGDGPKEDSPQNEFVENSRARGAEVETGSSAAITGERARPVLPGSALEAIVEEAKAYGNASQDNDKLGDSTINSLEDLIRPADDNNEELGEVEEDTLMGLQLPTEPPRNEAERQRQQELRQLHKMNQRLRAARTSIRDASRGMRRVEHRVEHVEENGQAVKIIYRDCPCASHGHHGPWTSLWISFKHLFRDPQVQKRMGLTWLGIFVLSFIAWCFMEFMACDRYCHKLYASSMEGFGVDPDAPRFPFVVPTLVYRWMIKPWWLPLWASLSFMGKMVYNTMFEDDTVRSSTTATAQFATRVLREATATDSFEADLSMGDDEII